MQEDAIEKIIEHYLEGTASVEEIDQLEQWYNSFECESDLYLPGTAELKMAMSKGFSDLKAKLGFP